MLFWVLSIYYKGEYQMAFPHGVKVTNKEIKTMPNIGSVCKHWKLTHFHPTPPCKQRKKGVEQTETP